MQGRYGPNRVGPYGALQPLADILKLLTKEQFRPTTSVGFLFALAPAHLDPHRGRGVRDHPLRRRPAHLRRTRRAVRRRRLDRPAVPVRVRRDRLLRDHARRLVLGLEVLVPRRDARRGAADLLRGLPGPRAGRRDHDRADAVADGDRQRPERHVVLRAAVRRLPDLPHRQLRRDQPRPVRSHRGRRRARRRLQHRVRRRALRLLLLRRVPQRARRLRASSRPSSSAAGCCRSASTRPAGSTRSSCSSRCR